MSAHSENLRGLKATGVAAIFAMALLLGAPRSAHAATCSQYSNQADAQRAADTRDADGDGIYCEALPCPCLGPGQSSGGGTGGGHTPTRKPKPRKHAQTITARITSVVDGDTLRVRAFNAKRDYYTVRLIGIDTPETKRPGTPVECGGRRATSYMLSLAFTAPRDTDSDGVLDEAGGDGRRVTLTTDPTQDTFDRYDRLLAYVTTRAGVYLQTGMLVAGWATTYLYGNTPFQRVSRHRNAEARARAAHRGVYARCGGTFHKPQ